jgi:hypothetical protein
MGKKIKDLKGKYRKKGLREAQSRLKDIGVVDDKGDVEEYKPKRINPNYGRSYGKFRKEGNRFANNPFSRSGRFRGGTVRKYKDKFGKLRRIKSGPQTADNSGGLRKMGDVQAEANARYKKSAAFVRSAGYSDLLNKLKTTRMK